MRDGNKEKAKGRIITTFILILIPFMVGVLSGIAASHFTKSTPAIHDSTYSLTPIWDSLSAKWEYDIQLEKKWLLDKPEENWAYFDMDLKNKKENFNFSDCKAISFDIRGGEKASIEFNLFTHVFCNETHVRYQYPRIISVEPYWKKEMIYLPNLTLSWINPPTINGKQTPCIKSNASENPDLKKVYAIGFAAKTNETRIQNVILIDEVELIYKNGSKNTISNFSGTFNVNINGTEGYWFAWWGPP